MKIKIIFSIIILYFIAGLSIACSYTLEEGITNQDTISLASPPLQDLTSNPVSEVSGWQKVDGEWLFYDIYGDKLTGWHLINGEHYYFSDSGHMLSNAWIEREDGGDWYWAKEDGNMARDETLYIDRNQYHFDKNGVCTNPDSISVVTHTFLADFNKDGVEDVIHVKKEDDDEAIHPYIANSSFLEFIDGKTGTILVQNLLNIEEDAEAYLPFVLSVQSLNTISGVKLLVEWNVGGNGSYLGAYALISVDDDGWVVGHIGRFPYASLEASDNYEINIAFEDDTVFSMDVTEEMIKRYEESRIYIDGKLNDRYVH